MGEAPERSSTPGTAGPNSQSGESGPSGPSNSVDLVESRRIPPEVEDAIRGASESESAYQGVLTLAAIANRAVAELNRLARAESNARRGQADWGAWASLANAARDAVLKMATCRKGATELVRRSADQARSG